MYENLFSKYNMSCAQVLITEDDLKDTETLAQVCDATLELLGLGLRRPRTRRTTRRTPRSRRVGASRAVRLTWPGASRRRPDCELTASTVRTSGNGQVPRGSARTGFPLAVAPLERGPRRESPAPPARGRHVALPFRHLSLSPLQACASRTDRGLTVDRRPRRHSTGEDRRGASLQRSSLHTERVVALHRPGPSRTARADGSVPPAPGVDYVRRNGDTTLRTVAFGRVRTVPVFE